MRQILKTFCSATMVALFLGSAFVWAQSAKAVRPQIFAPSNSGPGGGSGGSQISGPEQPPPPSQEPATTVKEVRPAGRPYGHVAPPPPPHGHVPPPHYYYDPFYTRPTTVIVYEESHAEPVYVTTEIPDTLRLVNPFPVRYSLGIVGVFGPYAMTSDYRGYDFSGWIGGGGLTVQIPLNSTSLAFVTGAILTYRQATNTFDYYENGKPTGEDARYKFNHKNIDVPIWIRLRAPGSRLSFDLGGKILFNIRERLEIKDDSGKHTYDLDDDRNLVNYALSIGFNIDLNRWIALNLVSDFAFGDMYDVSKIQGIPAEFTESSLTIGVTFNIF